MIINSSNRIVFIDLMRAFAVLMMVQGHTINALLADEYCTFDSIFYKVWHSLRGFTAPIFMFSSGTVFTYLLMNKKIPFRDNPRVRKGIKRFLLLVSLGYLLRFPIGNLFSLDKITKQQWEIFYVVDALHLIGFGLLAILVLEFISEQIKINNYYVFSTTTFIAFLMAPIITSINWDNYLPPILSAYLFYKHNSIFPLFPWIGFVVAGGVFGNFLANNKDIFKEVNFVYKLILSGLTFVVFSFIVHYFRVYMIKPVYYWNDESALSFYRLGVVLILNSVMAFIAIKSVRVPDFFRIAGKHTLSIYVAHLILIYGSMWFPGLLVTFGKTLTDMEAIVIAVAMIVVMIFMAILIERYSPTFKKFFSRGAEAV